MSHPILLPGLRLLWRDDHHLQIGSDPERAVVLELAVPALAQLLALLDGSRTEDGVLREAVRLGIPPAAGAELLASLGRAGLVVGAHTLLPGPLPEPVRRQLGAELAALALQPEQAGPAGPTPAQALRRRAAARVLVNGYGRLAAPIAATLAAAGVGQVVPVVDGRATPADTAVGGLTPADSTRPRAAAAADAVARAAPGARGGLLTPSRATFIVQAGRAQPARLAALVTARLRVPVLHVEVRDGVVVTGPLVPPSGSPCLHCLDLHRTDRDAAWPRLAAQLASGPDTPVTCTVTTALAATAFAAHQVLGWIDGRHPETLGATVEISQPGRARRRTWPPHPRCDCTRPVRRQHQRDG
jgi:bacteriocin biosynthesis cyclodehydratase domain-containing protein